MQFKFASILILAVALLSGPVFAQWSDTTAEETTFDSNAFTVTATEPTTTETTETTATETATTESTTIETTIFDLQTTTPEPDHCDNSTLDLTPTTITIVWENRLSSTTERPKITRIFQSVLAGTNRKVVVSFNPSIRSLLFDLYDLTQTNFSSLNPSAGLVDSHALYLGPDDDPITDEIGDLFFLFNEDQKRIDIYKKCPSRTTRRIEFNEPWATDFVFIELFQDAYLFPSLFQALQRFCKPGLVIQPGTLLHFSGSLNKDQSTVLVSLLHENTAYYSINAVGDNKIQIVSTANTDNRIISLARSISYGFYILFLEDEVVVFDECPDDLRGNARIGSTNIYAFNARLNAEIMRKPFKSGLVLNPSLLEQYCLLNGFQGNNNGTQCVPAASVQSAISLIDKNSKLIEMFLPKKEQLEKIALLEKPLVNETDQEALTTLFNLDQLVVNNPRILIGASNFPQKSFFTQRTQREYESGFSDGQYNRWIGLDNLNWITEQRSFGVRVELGSYYEEYDSIRVGSRSNGYRLILGNPVWPTVNSYSLSYNNNSNFNGIWWNYQSTTRAFCLTCDNSAIANVWQFPHSAGPRRMYLLP